MRNNWLIRCVVKQFTSSCQLKTAKIERRSGILSFCNTVISCREKSKKIFVQICWQFLKELIKESQSIFCERTSLTIQDLDENIQYEFWEQEKRSNAFD